MHSTKDKGRDLDPALVKFYAFVLHAAGAILGGEIHLDVTSATKERCAIREIQRHNLEKTRTTIEIQKAMVIEGHLYLLNNASEDKIPHGAESPCEVRELRRGEWILSFASSIHAARDCRYSPSCCKRIRAYKTIL